MIFRSKKRRRTGAAMPDRPEQNATATDGSKSTEALLEEIDALTRENRARRDPDLERRILDLRHRAGLRLIERPAPHPEHPSPAFNRLPDGSELPEIAPGDELTSELLRAAILQSGCLLVRGLVDGAEVVRLVAGIDRAFEARDAHVAGRPADSTYYAPFEPHPRFDLTTERWWVGNDAGGLWPADSPRVMVDVLDVLERRGLRRLATEYLGERPVVSVNKGTLRRVKPDTGAGYDLWHQDGNFLGDDVRALNVWLSLSRCGDEAPGLDIIPRRLDRIVPSGTEGALFEWSVSRAVAEQAAGEVGILRPIFEPGDVLLFDDLFLHSTAADPAMPNTRYAVECWFFGPSGFPDDYAPLAF